MTTESDTPQGQVAAEGSFADLALSPKVQQAVQLAGYNSPTAIQAQIIPLMLEKRDVLAQSQTGTGKTAAFALPILSQLESQPVRSGEPPILVLAPTRELAMQISQSFETYGACIDKLTVAAIYGGADYEPQIRLLKRAQVVVGTPGRVMDHMRRGTLSLDSLRCLVLDEADEMLNMGFIEDVEFVLSHAPEQRQIALFSATMPEPIRDIAQRYLHDPATITIQRKTLTAENIDQRCVFVEEREKLELLARLIELEETDGVIVFTKTRESTLKVADHLTYLGLKAAALNGDLPQARRQRTVDQLKAGQLDILVATDVAARGLDVPRISHVFNYDLPHDGEAYVHRIGRTGRAGRSGVAYIFLTHRQNGKLRVIERLTKKPIQILEQPTAEQLSSARVKQFKSQIAQSLTSPECSALQQIIQDFVGESGQPLELVAAALARMACGRRSLFVKDAPKPPKRHRDRFDDSSFDGKHGSRGGDQRAGRMGGRAAGGDHNGVRRKGMQPAASGMQRYWIAVGHVDGVRPGNIVGAIANEAGIPGKLIGPINIFDEYSTIDLPDDLPRKVLGTLERTWVSGKQLRIREFIERERGASGFKGRRSRDQQNRDNSREPKKSRKREYVGR